MRQTSAQFERTQFGPRWGSVALFDPLRAEDWHGQSGDCYTHTVYSLIGCPAMVAANYILVDHDANGVQRVLSIGRTRSGTPSLNLARIRKRGAILGANEVHLLRSGETDVARAAIKRDLTRRHWADRGRIAAKH